MIIKQDEIAIILGDSPFLNEVQDKIQPVLDRYFSVGINRVINKFHTNVQVCIDERIIPVANQHPEIPTVSLYLWGDMIQKENKELLNMFTYSFRGKQTYDLVKDNKLAWCGFTHDYAISYCVYKGWKNIFLIGAADFTQGTHFSNEDTFNPAESIIVNSKRFIEEVCTKKANIFTCNPKSQLKIPRVPIERLIV